MATKKSNGVENFYDDVLVDENLVSDQEKTEFEIDPQEAQDQAQAMDAEVSSTNSGESKSYGQFEVDGIESMSSYVTDDPILDAFYGSYAPADGISATESAEVIIGADNRIKINATNVYPWRAICALKITTKNGRRFIGTGWMISKRTVITAGHCVYMHNEGGWVRSVEVIPGLNGALRPYSSAVGTSFRSTQGWVNSRSRNHDYGAIILPANTNLGNLTGSFGIAVKNDAFLKAANLNLSGYPGDKGGNEQWYMAQRTKSVSTRVIYYNIDTYGGQSGAPVWILTGGKRYAVGIHTNGASSGNSATRIVTAVFNNLVSWKNQGL
ncbi:MAG TPA: trypsin-like serine protease [Saprospiraceae bacterium]|nr:trypsin-like serine protease [Saprospiraceae bacterium]